SRPATHALTHLLQRFLLLVVEDLGEAGVHFLSQLFVLFLLAELLQQLVDLLFLVGAEVEPFEEGGKKAAGAGRCAGIRESAGNGRRLHLKAGSRRRGHDGVRPRQQTIERFGERRLIDGPFLLFVALGVELFHAGKQFGLGDLAVFVGVDGFDERLGDEVERTEAALEALAAGAEAFATRPFLEELARRLALFVVEPAVAVLVEILDQLARLSEWSAEAGAGAEYEVFLVLFADFLVRVVFLLRLRLSQERRGNEGGEGQPSQTASRLHRISSGCSPNHHTELPRQCGSVFGMLRSSYLRLLR